MKNLFMNLNIGDIFHTGKSKGSGINSNTIYWLEYKKIDKSHAICIKQVGYGNNRMEGHINPFSANSIVWNI